MGEAALWGDAAGTCKLEKARLWVSFEEQWKGPGGFSVEMR